MRILMILRAPVGGLFRHVGDLTEALAQRGHEIAVVADSGSGDAQTAGKLAAIAEAARLGVFRLPLPRLLGTADLTTPLRLRRLAHRLGIDVVHGHGAKGGLAARLVRMAGGAPVALYTPHGGVLHYSPQSPTGRLFRRIERWLLRQTDAIIFESAFARDAFTAGIAAPRCPAPIIHNGLRPEEFERVEPVAKAHDFVFVGELRELKGIRYLLEALPGLRRPDGRPATLIMAGDGPDRAAFAAAIGRLGLNDRVELAGVRPAREMFARGHCVVVPSLAESLPYVVLEAAAAGRPVIAARVGGIREIFGPTEPSLVSPADTPALAAALARFLADPNAAAREAATRLAFIASRFSVAHMTDEIEALYRQLLPNGTEATTTGTAPRAHAAE
jgi:glycosyltransferase involved in cell wall biosynthesis